jgi:3-hydroxybutyryl-CoA dehydrogenase
LSKALVLGDALLANELAGLCRAAGHQVQEMDTATQLDALPAASAQAEVVLECLNSSKTAKLRLSENISAKPVLFVSAMACSTTEAASLAADPSKVVGWSALSPLLPGGTVEVAAGLQTRPETLAQALAFWRSLGCSPVQVGDGPGLVRARILSMLINEAATAALEGVAACEDIDAAMTLGVNYPRGLFAWCDLIGVKVVLNVLAGLQQEYGEERYRPSPLLVRYAQAGRSFFANK